MATILFLISVLLGILFLASLFAPKRLLPGENPKRSKALLVFLLPSLVAMIIAVRSLPDPTEAYMDDPTATEIDLSSEHLYRLPQEFSQFTQLQTINLAGNNLSELPEVLLSLPALQKIDVSRNGIDLVPEGLKNLSQLEELNLASNPLEELPDWMGDLPSLKSLDLSYTRITRLPQSLKEKAANGDLALTYANTEAYYADYPEERPAEETEDNDEAELADTGSESSGDTDHSESFGSFARRQLFGRDDLGHKRIFGEGEVYYDDPVTQEMADSVGSFMTQLGFFSEENGGAVQLLLNKDKTRYILNMATIHSDADEIEEDIKMAFKFYAMMMAEVLPDQLPIDWNLCDDDLDVLTTVTSD